MNYVWEEVFANNISNKGIVSRMYKELSNHSSKTKQNKNNYPIRIWAKDMNRRR